MCIVYFTDKDMDSKVMVNPWSHSSSSLEQVQIHRPDTKIYALIMLPGGPIPDSAETVRNIERTHKHMPDSEI